MSNETEFAKGWSCPVMYREAGDPEVLALEGAENKSGYAIQVVERLHGDPLFVIHIIDPKSGSMSAVLDNGMLNAFGKVILSALEFSHKADVARGVSVTIQ